MRRDGDLKGKHQQQRSSQGVPGPVMVLFVLVIVSIILFAFMGVNAAQKRSLTAITPQPCTTSNYDAPQSSSSVIESNHHSIGLRGGSDAMPSPMTSSHSLTSLWKQSGGFDDFAHIGRQLECMELINAEVAPKIDTLVRMPRRIATVMLSTMALDVEGDFVEAGVFTGGASVLMFSVLACANSSKHHWMADSFQGLPDPNESEGDTKALGVKQEAWEQLSKRWTASQSTLYENLDMWRVWWGEQEGTHRNRYGRWERDDQRLHTLAGWFKDTLSVAPIEKISFLRCDADMYSSTRECLVFMYPKLSPGGFVYIDDYWSFEACKKAVDDFRVEAGISRSPLYTVVEDSHFHFQKDMTLMEVRAHRQSFPRGNDKRHVDAVFWRK